MATIGTRLWTWWKGELVGEDQFGNRYYREKGKPARGRRGRWVLFNGETEASKTPPDWHAWLHRTSDAPPSEKPLETKPWQQPHIPNLTGTALAYRPPGDRANGPRPEGVPAPYEAWRPDSD